MIIINLECLLIIFIKIISTLLNDKFIKLSHNDLHSGCQPLKTEYNKGTVSAAVFHFTIKNKSLMTRERGLPLRATCCGTWNIEHVHRIVNMCIDLFLNFI